MDKWASLVIGGILGTVSRYLVYAGVARVAGPVTFPFGTLTVNLAGCLIIGFISVFSDVKHVLGMDARLFLVTGFCGAFTTFSALILEASDLVRDGHAPRAFVYVLVSVAAGMLFFRAGEFLAERLT